MGAVVVKVEVEFSGSTWTDVSAWARMSSPITVTGGRSDTDSRVQPGRLSGLELDNDDGRFTVGNTAGAYSPNVRSGKRVRVSIKDPGSSTYYERFTGYIDGWPMRWESGHCFVTLSATDALGQLLNKIDTQSWADFNFLGTPSDYYDQQPAVYYWRFTDDREDLAHSEARGAYPMEAVTSTVPVATVTGPTGSPDPLPECDTEYWEAAGWSTDGVRWVASVLFKSSDKSVEKHPLYVHDGTNGVYAVVNTSGQLRVGITGVGTVATGAATDICDGRWWRLQLTAWDAGATWSVIGAAVPIDGTTPSSTGSLTGYTSTQLVGDTTVTMRVGSNTAGGSRFTVGHACWMPPQVENPSGTFTTSSVPTYAHHSMPYQSVRPAGTNSPDLDFPGMFNAWAPFPVTADTPDEGGSFGVLLKRPALVGTWLDLWKSVEDVFGGVTYATAVGTIVYRPHLRAVTSASVDLELTAATVESLEVAADRLKVVNDASVTLKQVGTLGNDEIVDSVQIEDDDSITNGGRHPITHDAYGNIGYVAPLWGGAAKIAERLMQPAEVPRVPRATVDAFTMSTADQLSVLADVDMWSLIGVTDLPSTGGFADRWLGRVEGWSETIGATEWRITFNTSFAGSLVGDSTFAKIGTMKLG